MNRTTWGLLFLALFALVGMLVLIGSGVEQRQRARSECLRRGYQDAVLLSELSEVWCTGQRNGNTITERLQ